MTKKLAFIFPSSACQRPIDQSQIYIDPRGLTGSEAAWWECGQRLKQFGFEVTFFGNFRGRLPGTIPDSDWPDYADDSWHAVVSYVHPEPLRLCKPETTRVLVQQCNDWNACAPDWTTFVDYLIAPGRDLLRHLLAQTDFPAEHARVFHNGHAHGPVESVKRVPGRMLWASSHDRGLPWALQVFQQLRKAFIDPDTRTVYPPLDLSFHVAYNADGMNAMAQIPPDAKPDWVAALGKRSRFCQAALPQLQSQGVTVLGSLSREQMALEMAQAEILLYPCDPVNWTEGFSNTTCEAMAMGCLPVLCFSDAFVSLWKGAVPGVMPADVYTADGSRHHQLRFLPKERDYISLVRSLLTGITADGADINEWRRRAAARASFFHWDAQVESLARFLGGDTAALPGPEYEYPWASQKPTSQS